MIYSLLSSYIHSLLIKCWKLLFLGRIEKLIYASTYVVIYNTNTVI